MHSSVCLRLPTLAFMFLKSIWRVRREEFTYKDAALHLHAHASEEGRANDGANEPNEAWLAHTSKREPQPNAVGWTGGGDARALVVWSSDHGQDRPHVACDTRA